jgi:diacylglycerol kinase (ATP)
VPHLEPRIAPSHTTPPALRKVLVLANPVAGRGRGERLARELEAHLSAAGCEVQSRLTGARGDALRWTRERDSDVDIVVSVGGDGTLREVFAGLDGVSTPVAVAPLGTANVLSLDLRLPHEPREIAAMALRGRTQILDVARVNDTLSFLVTGVGLDAAVVAEVERARRGPITKLAYLGATLRALRDYRAPRLAVELDGRPVEGPVGMLLASNIIHYGGSFRLSPDRRLDDGLFEVYLFRDARPFALGLAAARAALVGLPGGSCEMRRAKHVRVLSEPPAPYHVDGDRGGATPLELEVCGRRRLIVP